MFRFAARSNILGFLAASPTCLAQKVKFEPTTRLYRRSMSNLKVDLTAPNGLKYRQPIGLFINNEWVRSSDEGKIASINPT